jgi:hypothetical protein
MESAPPILNPVSMAESRRWGIGATLGLSVAIFAAWQVAQTLGIGIVLGFRLAHGQSLPNLSSLSRDLVNDGTLLWTATLTGLPVVIAMTTLFASLRRPMSVRDYLGFRLPTARETGRWIAAVVFFEVVVGTAEWAASRFFGRPGVSEFMQSIYESSKGNPFLWIAILVAAPVGEELLFRGFLFSGLGVSRTGPVWAAIISSAAWAGIHVQYDLLDRAGLFALGLLLAATWWRTRSLPLCILLHFVVSLVATLEMVLRYR